MKALRGYARAAVSVTAALLLTLAIPAARQKAPYLLLTLGVMVGARMGLGPGLFATLAGAAMGAYFIIPPSNSFALSGPEDLVPLLLFCSVGTAITWIAHGLHLSREKLMAANGTLAEAQRQTTTLLESISDGFMTFDRDWRHTFVNGAAANMLNLRPEQLLGRNLWEAWPAAAASPFGAAFRRAVEENTAVEVEAFYPEPLNRWYLVRAYPSAEGLTLFVRDVTERRQAEESLRESEARLSLVMESTDLGTFDYYPQTGKLNWSASAKRHFGVAASAEVDFDTFLRGLHPDDRPRVTQIVSDVLQPASGGHYNTEYRTIGLEDGQERWLAARGQVFFNEEGEAARFIGVTLDITDRKRAEARLLQTQKLESLGILAGGVAHDFNNLLVGVLGNASLAGSLLEPEHAASPLLEQVVSAGQQAAHLTRQMLAYSGKGRFFLERVDLSELIPEIRGLVQTSIPKRIEIELRLEPGLPLVEADRGQLQQVFMNLVLNAAEAIGSTAGRIVIQTGVEEIDLRAVQSDPQLQDLSPGRYVTLQVCDTGCGMDEATRARIFDPFFSTKFTGRGLGLAAVAGILRGHHGAITVSSQPGQGACFTAYFPAQEGVRRPVAAAEEAWPARSEGTVLVVDDEDMVLRFAGKALEKAGFRVLLASGGPQAIELLKQHSAEVSIVLLDLSMPGMGGEEALPLLIRIRPDLKVVVSSGYSEAETLLSFGGNTVSGFIQKPYTFEGLAQAIQRAMGRG